MGKPTPTTKTTGSSRCIGSVDATHTPILKPPHSDARQGRVNFRLASAKQMIEYSFGDTSRSYGVNVDDIKSTDNLRNRMLKKPG